MDPEDPPADMEYMYKTLEDYREVKEDREDLECVIRNAKRSAANRAVLAYKLNTENNQHLPL